MREKEIRRRIEALPWFHRIPLGHGIETPGPDISSADKIEFNKIPPDLRGKTVLDVGAWDGLFSFEAERRGASRVLATDSVAWGKGGWGSKECFLTAREILDSKVEDLDVDVMDIAPETVGGLFDVVFFLGVLYHLRHPFLAIEKVASVTREMLLLSTSVDMLSHERPAAAFFPGDELGGDPTNWWAPNPACVEAMLRDVGFVRVEMVTLLIAGGGKPVVPHVAAFHAWKPEAQLE